MKYLRLLPAIFLSLSFLVASPLFAQDDFECSTDNIEACNVDLTLYCQGEGPVPMNFGLDPDNCDSSGCPIHFTATFADKPPVSRLPLFFVDGQVENGNVNETRISTLRCKGSECTGIITIDRAQALQTKFDFDQAVINIVLRRRTAFGKDFCIGKFTNNPELISQNDSSTRSICSLNPTEGNEAVTGTGFFTPGGYGTDGSSLFHLSLEGLPTDTVYKGCSVIGTDRYKSVFSFQPVLLSTASDNDVYGTLTDKEQAAFDANPFLFSYELRRSVASSVSSASRSLLFTPSLSLINKSVSSSTGSKTVRESNAATRKERRRKKRRKQKNQSSRSRSADLQLAKADSTSSRALEFSRARKQSQQEVISWLNFDPLSLAGTLVISESCSRNVLENSIGSLVCGGDAEDATRRCRTFSFGTTGLSASACKEVKDSVGQLTIRARNSTETEFSICLNGSLIDTTLPVVQGTDVDSPTFPFGERKLTENEALVAGDSSFTLLGLEVSSVNSVALSISGNCSDTLSSVSF